MLIESGAIAAVAITFASYALRLVGRPDAAPVPLAIAAIVLLSLVNYFGVKPGSRVLNVLVVLKVAALAVLIVAGAFAPAAPAWWSAARDSAAPSAASALAFGAALVPILFAYGGWQNANYLAEEIDDPRRNLPLSLLAGTLAVVVIYVAVNVVYLRALGLEGLAATTTPASTAAAIMFGAARRSLRHGGDRDFDVRLPGPRDPGADARVLRDGGRRRVPSGAGAAAPEVPDAVDRDPHPIDVVVRAGADRTLRAVLLNYVVFADWIFFGLTVATLMVFRRTYPLSRRPPARSARRAIRGCQQRSWSSPARLS